MTKNAIALILLALISKFATVEAADGAKFRAIGFSHDVKFFAFEQYGVQDGSGFSYDDVFVLDIAKDDWVKGTPIRVLLEDETGSVATVRKSAMAKSKVMLQRAGITDDAELLAASPFTEIVAERSKVSFHDHYNNGLGVVGDPENEGTWTLSASAISVPLPTNCEADLGVQGYKLELKNNKSNQTTVLHQDKSIPSSRGCSIAYDIEAIVQPVGGSTSGQLVAIIGVSSQGFEGADRRFIAVPFKFN